VIPQKDINLTQSLLVAYRDLFSTFHVPWMGNVMAVMLAFGVLLIRPIIYETISG
jgi:hypothetical protein